MKLLGCLRRITPTADQRPKRSGGRLPPSLGECGLRARAPSSDRRLVSNRAGNLCRQSTTSSSSAMRSSEDRSGPLCEPERRYASTWRRVRTTVIGVPRHGRCQRLQRRPNSSSPAVRGSRALVSGGQDEPGATLARWGAAVRVRKAESDEPICRLRANIRAEAVPGALPERNRPQRHAFGIYPSRSGTAITAPRAENGARGCTGCGRASNPLRPYEGEPRSRPLRCPSLPPTACAGPAPLDEAPDDRSIPWRR